MVDPEWGWSRLEADCGRSGSRWNGWSLCCWSLMGTGWTLCNAETVEGQPAQYILYQLHQRQHGRLQPFLLWFIVCWTNVNCFHHRQQCERLDTPHSFLSTYCVSLPSNYHHRAVFPPHSTTGFISQQAGTVYFNVHHQMKVFHLMP